MDMERIEESLIQNVEMGRMTATLEGEPMDAPALRRLDADLLGEVRFSLTPEGIAAVEAMIDG